jgi:hypothetical protein
MAVEYLSFALGTQGLITSFCGIYLEELSAAGPFAC